MESLDHPTKNVYFKNKWGDLRGNQPPRFTGKWLLEQSVCVTGLVLPLFDADKHEGGDRGRDPASNRHQFAAAVRPARGRDGLLQLQPAVQDRPCLSGHVAEHPQGGAQQCAVAAAVPGRRRVQRDSVRDQRRHRV